MGRKIFLMFLVALLSAPFIIAIGDTSILFNATNTEYINITINNTQISGFSFNVTGGIYNSSYPSNITIDVGNDSIIDWEYNSYHSNISAYAEIVTTAWSTNPNSAEVDIMSNMTDIGNGVNLGYLKNNIFYDYSNVQNGTLGIREFEGNSITKQIMSIVTNISTIHAFLPAISGYFNFAGLYVAEGGSTYYCNSDHTFNDTYGCNLTVAEAMTPAHLARESNISNYSTTEPVTNLKMKETINSQLAICGSPPCNITIKVTSATSGNITLSDFQVIGADPPANITIVENTTDYNVNISPYALLTDVKYFYGTMPNVYIAPVVAKDNITALSANQSARLDMLESTLKQGWDNLTNFSHPLNFTFYMTPIIINYSVSENDFSNFSDKAYEKFEDNIQSPAIIVILDIYDYFPNRSAYITRTTIDEYGRIGLVYLNGFSDHNNDTALYNYDSEILKNVLLHELMHAFVFYPSVGDMFYVDHPSSFTDISSFETYNVSESPTANEGYYEIYSILNQLRPYIASEDIGGYVPSLSILDKMLLGIISR